MNKLNLLISTLTVLLFIIVGLTESKVISGNHYRSQSNWNFIDKFAMTLDSHVTIDIEFVKGDMSSVLLYSDKHWDYIIKNDQLTCQELESMAEAKIDNGSPYNENYPIPIYQQRARYWYVVFSNCIAPADKMDRTHLGKYSITMENRGDKLNRVISADEQFTPHMSIIALIVLFAVFIVSVHSISVQTNLGYRSEVMKLFTSAVVLKMVSLLILIGYYAEYYAQDTNLDNLKLASNCVDIFARSVFGLVLLLLSQGFNVSTMSPSLFPRVLTSAFFLVYLVYSLAASIFYDCLAKLYRVQHYYIDTAIGYPILGVVGCMFIYFIFSTFHTRSQQLDATRRKLLCMVGCIFSLWFFCYPAATIISHFVADTVRFRSVTCFNQITETLFYMIFSGLFVGCSSNKFIHIFNPISTHTNDKLKTLDI
ncbi:hypothetical protein DFA_09114 [Cavenderia fasciculata]|uniref:GPR180/TMEM145 transmembrane domain-containing protein n=1 Tax=Cavenderia fasciculata TaxID=261658 RepID=F4Q6Q7_CACFS|nr:uncharacterized protein DFA_09114 [Cavenderia fasciculata]EGG16567.1 hypothetical protein DFA_09114 [Cavenderia fasciculata]|eukprot:XP_004354967.1 hypothetical protein DFA_09114 [Cavenderia fasciculata]